MDDSRTADPVWRMWTWVRRARCAAAAAGVLFAVVLFGTGIQVSDPEGWSWPPSVLPLLLTMTVLLVLVWVPVEAGWRTVECLRVRPAWLATHRREPGNSSASPEPDHGMTFSDEALRGYFLGLYDRDPPGAADEPFA